MIVGTTILNMASATYYSPAFPRGGEAATFSVSVTGITADTTLNVVVEHRNEAETTWATLGSFTGITAGGVSTKDLSSIEELVRFKYSLAGTNSDGAVHVIIPAPAWRPY